MKNCLVAARLMLCFEALWGIVGVSTMNENGAEVPEQVVKFEPKARPRSYDTPLDEAGQAIIAKIQWGR